MATGELDLMIQHAARALEAQIDWGAIDFHPGKFSIWLRFIRLTEGGEQEVLPAHKLVREAMTEKELRYLLAEQVVLTVFGSELTVVTDLPNLVVKLNDRKSTVHLPGAPPLEQPDQIFLKVTVYRYEPGLWARLFGSKQEG